jgi:hypothetical protein
MRARAVVFVALVALAGSVAPAAPPEPLVRFVDSTGAYARWWRDIAHCARRELPRPFDSVRFLQQQTTPRLGLGVSSVGFIVAGLAYPEDGIIVLGSPWLRDSGVVRHEMLHLVVGAVHDAEYFQRRCAAVVTCVGACLSDTLPMPKASKAPR